MAEAFYSIVLDHPAADVWSVIRPFGHYAWAGVTGTTTIEDGMAADQVGAVRRVGSPPQKVRDYVATIRVMPVVDSGQAFVEWRATFDALDAGETGQWKQHFEQQGFAVWLAALRDFMRPQNDRSYAASSV